jgi:hypothetical protein
MHTCTCGQTFPGTLAGAWEAKLHAETKGHRLAAAPAELPRATS